MPMKNQLVLIALAIALLNGMALLPALQAEQPWMLLASLLLAFALAARAAMASQRAPSSEVDPALAEAAARPAPSATPPPAPPPATDPAAFAVLSVLASMQERGRLIDFLMEDISRATDTQLAAVARIVHSGCKAALSDTLKVTPICEAAEGSRVPLPEESERARYRLLGDAAEAAEAKVVHRGWQADALQLSRPLSGDAPLPPLAPAQLKL